MSCSRKRKVECLVSPACVWDKRCKSRTPPRQSPPCSKQRKANCAPPCNWVAGKGCKSPARASRSPPTNNLPDLDADLENKFLHACATGTLHIVKMLSAWVGPSTHTHGFRLASANGHLDVVKYLVDDLGADTPPPPPPPLRSPPCSKQRKANCAPPCNWVVGKGCKSPARGRSRGRSPPPANNPTDLEKSFLQACTNGTLRIVKTLSAWVGPSTHTRGFRLASANGHLDVVKYLVGLGADINAEDHEAIQFASANGHLDVVKYLASQGADVRIWGDSPVKLACEHGHLPVVKYLVEEWGADVEEKEDNEVPIQQASENGHLDVVKYLVSQGVDLYGAISQASGSGHLDIVKYLVSVGADIHEDEDEDEDIDESPIKWARENGHHHVVKYLENLMYLENLSRP
jgi:ankyrin repeat protein